MQHTHNGVVGATPDTVCCFHLSVLDFAFVFVFNLFPYYCLLTAPVFSNGLFEKTGLFAAFLAVAAAAVVVVITML